MNAPELYYTSHRRLPARCRRNHTLKRFHDGESTSNLRVVSRVYDTIIAHLLGGQDGFSVLKNTAFQAQRTRAASASSAATNQIKNATSPNTSSMSISFREPTFATPFCEANENAHKISVKFTHG